MQREEFLKLFEKQLNGTLTPAEEIRLSAWFEQQQSQGLPGWNEQVLGSKNELEDNIYQAVKHSERKTRFLNLHSPWLKVAASALIVSAISLFWFKFKPFSESKIAAVNFTDAKALYGQVLKIQLADSSTVWLNAGSHLRYPEKFEGKTRELYLEGEAFFEVKHKEKQPFIVHSGALNTQVLGTSFNIKAYHNNKKLKVTVASGKVAVYTNQVSAVYLTPDETGEYNTVLHQISTKHSEAKDIIAWKEGKLIYRNELLGQALEDLANKYGIKITSSLNMRACQIYGTFRHDNPETLLKMISYSVGGRLTKKGDEFYITGKGCN